LISVCDRLRTTLYRQSWADPTLISRIGPITVMRLQPSRRGDEVRTALPFPAANEKRAGTAFQPGFQGLRLLSLIIHQSTTRHTYAIISGEFLGSSCLLIIPESHTQHYRATSLRQPYPPSIEIDCSRVFVMNYPSSA
jgi:hypothetical protein